MMQLHLATALAWATLSAFAQPATEYREQFLDRFEARVRLPPGSKPLKAYSRAYFPVEGGAKIMGIYSLIEPAGRRWVATHPGPFVMDGGCAIITVTIDTATEAVEHVECNGVG